MAEDFSQEVLNSGIPAGLLDGKGVPVSAWATTPASKADPSIDPRDVLYGQVTRAIPSALTGPIKSSAKEAEKYINQDFGFLPSSIRDNEDFYAEYQSGLEKIGKGLLKLPLYTVTKLGAGVGYVAGMVNPVNMFSKDGYISSVADNSISGFFNGWEDEIKNQWLPTFQEAEDRDKGFFSRAFTDVDFWTEDFVDGLAFMASAWVPGLALSKLGVGLKAINALSKFGSIGAKSVGGSIEAVGATTNYFKNAATYAKGLDKFNSWALATSSESMFEAKGVKDSIMLSLEDSNLSLDEKKKIAGDGARNAFIMNAALLGATNVFELPLVSKILNKTEGVARGISGGLKLGEDAILKQATTKTGKFLESGYGRFAKDATNGLFREGFIEENGQLAIQRFNEQYGAKGKVADMLDFSTYSEVGSNYLKQTYGALSGDDIEASTSIGLGGILGGGMTTLSNARQSKRDKITTDQAVDYYNLSQANWLKFGNVYATEKIAGKDANGNDTITEKIRFDENKQPIIDQEKLAGISSSVRSNAAAIDQTDQDTNLLRKNLIRDNAFSEFVLAHINAGMEGNLINKLDAVAKSSPEEMAKLGFMPDETTTSQINRYKTLAANIIKQNKIINSDIIFDNSKEDLARKHKLTDLAAKQAVYRGLVIDEQNGYNEIRNEIINDQNTSLTDGIVDQLNDIQLKIQNQEQYIKQLKNDTSGITKGQVKIATELLSGFKDQLATLLADNETSVKSLKQFNNGLYQYEKEERNNLAYLNPLLKKRRNIASIQNHIVSLGREWGMYADFKTGKSDFLNMFIDQQIKEPVNNLIEEENNQVDNAPQPISKPPAAPAVAAQPVVQKKTEVILPDDLETFLQQQYNSYKSAVEFQGDEAMPYDIWKLKAGVAATTRWKQNKEKNSAITGEVVTPAPVVPTTSINDIDISSLEAPDSDIETKKADIERTTPTEELTLNEQPVSSLQKEIEELDANLRKDLGATTKLMFMKPGSIGYDKAGNKYQVLSKKEKYGKSLEYRKNDGTEQSFNPLTATDQVPSSLGYYPEAFTELYSKNPVRTLERYEKDKFELEQKYEKLNEIEEEPLNEESLENLETASDAKDYIQNLDKLRFNTIADNNLSNAEYLASYRQIAPYNSLANTTDIADFVPAGNNKTRQERIKVNENYVFDVATSSFMPSQKVTYKVMTDGFEPVVNRITGEMYEKNVLFDDNWNAKTENFDFIPIAVFAEIRGKEVMIGTIHEPQWIERKINGEYVNIAIPEEQKTQSVPQAVEEQVNKNRELRKYILENYNKNHNFVIEGIVEDKSLGILRTTELKAPIKERVNPKIAEGGIDNRHGVFGIVRNGSIESALNVEINNIQETASFSSDKIADYQGITVLLLPTPLGTFFPSFIKLPNVSTEQSVFIIEAWKAFTGQTQNAEMVKAVYDAMGLVQSPGDFSIGILRDYINHYITILDEDKISRLGNGNELPDGAARLNITNKGGLEMQVMSNGTWFSTDKPIMKAEELPVDYLVKMSNLKTSIKFTSEKNENLKGINSVGDATILSIKNGKLSKEKMTYNQYIMNNASTFIEKGIESKTSNKDWVYFANPVIKMKLKTTTDSSFQNDDIIEETPQAPPKIEEVNAERPDKGAQLLAALKAKELQDQQIEEQKENCNSLSSQLKNIM